MLKYELTHLKSFLLAYAYKYQVPAGGALALDRDLFSDAITHAITHHEHITLHRTIVKRLEDLEVPDATIIATGPLTHDSLAAWLQHITGDENMAFFDAAAPIIDAASIDENIVFRQSRYDKHTTFIDSVDVQDSPAAVKNERTSQGDYLNAPFSKEEYDAFIQELTSAQRVIAKDFETKDLFQACQPIEEIARKHVDAPRFGPMKPVGLTDPRTEKRPWAAVQLRAENAAGSAYNMVGFQTNLTFPEQKRVFRMIPGLEHAEFFRYGVMHKNTFIHAPKVLDEHMRIKEAPQHVGPIYMAGQVMGTEGYVEAIASGLVASLNVYAYLCNVDMPPLPQTTSFGALLAYATNPETCDYQPMHVNFGIMPVLEEPIKKKDLRYQAYMERGHADIKGYVCALQDAGLM